jgi:hypothetical protein
MLPAGQFRASFKAETLGAFRGRPSLHNANGSHHASFVVNGARANPDGSRVSAVAEMNG